MSRSSSTKALYAQLPRGVVITKEVRPGVVYMNVSTMNLRRLLADRRIDKAIKMRLYPMLLVRRERSRSRRHGR